MRINGRKPKSTSSLSVTCLMCNKIMGDKRNLERHMRNHTHEKPFQCSKCEKSFTLAQSLKKHERIHSGVKLKVTCSYCQKSINKWYLSSHIKNHLAGRSHQCSLCPKSFCTIPVLNDHLRRHLGEKWFKCLQCLKCFVTTAELKVHLQTHSEKRPFPCKICNKKFKRNLELKRHKSSVHSTEKPFQCNHEDCKKVFKTRHSLGIHQQCHATRKNHICQVCNKGFVRMSDLKSHLQVHTSEKSYKCPVCGKMYKQPASVRKHHKQRHMAFKPFECIFCGSTFTQSQSLFKHLRGHNKEKTLICKVCGKEYSHPTNLKFHRMKFHG